MNIAIIGLGRMGVTQARIARQFGDVILWGIDRSGAACQEFQDIFSVPCYQNYECADFRHVELIWITVSDACISTVASEISNLVSSKTYILHTSGVMDYRAVKAELGHCFCAAFHPLRACPLKSVCDSDCALAYRNVVHAVDGDVQAVELAHRLVSRIGGVVVEINSDKKALYHAAAVFASNYPLAILDVAARLFEECGFEHDKAASVVRTMCLQCVNSCESTSFADALTGPVKRHDMQTIALHEAALINSPDILYLYQALKNASFNMLCEHQMYSS